ncbi:MAG: hypothetical protein RIR26_2447 [Pseudomonadota bacterium]
MLFANGVLSQALLAGLFLSPQSFSGDRSVEDLQPLLVGPAWQLKSADGTPRIIQSGQWHWNGIPIEGTPFKTVRNRTDVLPSWFAGAHPVSEELLYVLSSRGEFRFSPEQAQTLFAQNLRLGSWQLPRPGAVLQINGSTAENWWKLTLPQGRVFWLRDSDGVWGEELPLPLQADAKALLYRENKVVSASTGLEEIPLKDLLDMTYLRSKFFRILNCLGESISFEKCGNYARAKDGVYSYPFDSVEYSEMAGYYSIQRAMTWHRDIQSAEQKSYFENFALKGPIDVFVRAKAENAPYYVPRSTAVESSNPVIVVSTGSEKEGLGDVLSYLSKDSDVYFHEFSHHIIYRSVAPKSSPSQARALQEGLADYFAFAITGNNALGESTLGNEPLRKGDSTEKLGNDILERGDLGRDYDLGTILSSTLWSLRAKTTDWKTGYKQMDKIVWDAVDLLPTLATYYQFACALYLQAETFEKSEKLTAGSLRGPITTELVSRAFFSSSTPAAGENCPPPSDPLKAADILEEQESKLPLIQTPRTPVTFTGEGKSALPPFAGSLYQPLQRRSVFCGSLALSSAHSNSPASGVVLLLVPVFLIGSRPRKSFRWLRRRPENRRSVATK